MKKYATFTIDVDIIKKFRELCQKNAQSYSKVIEMLIKKWIGEK